MHGADDVIRPIVALKILSEDGANAKLVYAMLDSGSDRDVVSEELITDMDLTQRYSPRYRTAFQSPPLTELGCLIDFCEI